MIFIVQPDYLAIDPSHTVHLQGPPRAIYTFAPLGLQFSSENTESSILEKLSGAYNILVFTPTIGSYTCPSLHA